MNSSLTLLHSLGSTNPTVRAPSGLGLSLAVIHTLKVPERVSSTASKRTPSITHPRPALWDRPTAPSSCFRPIEPLFDQDRLPGVETIHK